jgi:hypothetical protein
MTLYKVPSALLFKIIAPKVMHHRRILIPRRTIVVIGITLSSKEIGAGSR